MQSKIEYSELAKAKVSEARNVVISACSKGGFTIAQQLEAKEGNNIFAVFLKGAIQVDDVNGLYDLRDALNLAIQRFETDDDIQWDDEFRTNKSPWEENDSKEVWE